MNTKHKVVISAAVVALTGGLAGTVATAATTTTAPHASGTGIVGSYYWNADAFTGTLAIDSVSNGTVVATLTDYGLTETLSGTWDGTTNVLHLTRAKQRGSGVQQYTYVLGGAPNEALPTMFGGYFTDTNTGSFEYGTYLDAAL
jgi:hypothetical protein